MPQNALSIDGFGPLPGRTPDSVPALCEVVREAAGSGRGVYPVGGGTMIDLGFTPCKPGFAVDLGGLNAVIDHAARDMTITAQAGITIARLQAVLAKEGQWLPVDVPEPEYATLGGAVATNASGPRRFAQGTLRDYVIGISFVTDEGAEVKAGGRVVKNVAGYDLMKLHTGALGTLGVVTQVTLKVKPRPEAAAAVAFGLDTPDLPAVLDLLHASKARPAVAELSTDATAIGRAPWAVLVAFEEKAETVAWQMATLMDEIKAAPVKYAIQIPGPDVARHLRDLTDETAGLFEGGMRSRFTFKANVRPSRTAEFCAAAFGPNVRVNAHALNGIVYGHVLPGLPAGDAAAMLERLTDLAADGGGNVVVRKAPPELKAKLPVWGRPSADRAMMREVKRALDPGDVFNPGRLFGPG